jgi:hypothetical protein
MAAFPEPPGLCCCLKDVAVWLIFPLVQVVFKGVAQFKEAPMLPTILLLATTISAEVTKPTAPVLRLARATEKSGFVAFTFEVTNPNANPLPYLGYESGSFDPKIPAGTIAPLYKAELLLGKEWKEHKIGWCGTGIGPVTIPAKGKVKFSVLIPVGEWEKVRVGLVWFATADEKSPHTAWTRGIDRKDVKKEK